MTTAANRMTKAGLVVTLFVGLASVASAADPVAVEMFEATIDGQGRSLGVISVQETPYGLVFTPDLKGIIPGSHGFHVHAKGDCAPGPDAKTREMIAAGAAGGHFDPKNTGHHSFPWDDNGHMGDLPALYVDSSGNATEGVLAPRLKKLSDIRGHALMIHVGGDNYADQPKPLGGGGARFACGVIK